MSLAATSDILIEDYATGVMDRLGLGAEALKAVNSDLIYISASGMGRTGPESHAVAYGTLLQSYAGFAGLNRHPDVAPRIGFAWLGPMCGLMLAFAAAALWHRQHKAGVAEVDFSMIEAMLWTMADPLITAQLGTSPKPMGNASTRRAARRLALRGRRRLDQHRRPHRRGVAGPLPPGADCRICADSIATDASAQTSIDAFTATWAASRSASAAAEMLLKAGIPAAALARHGDLVKSPHLAAREFWDEHGAGVLPGLPWRASFGRTTGPAPGLGADTDHVLASVLGLSSERIAGLRASGAAG